ncbi:hypothetical protein RRG08_055589 [Elysia crispata]|uniref:Uncharacterized protein n=1 Tax=Elysia crispata TaxID=231223 RepID=A0AAE1B1X7_9GAST|nr:hypothetical protein RRG08_055589 [Elysia crispata]
MFPIPIFSFSAPGPRPPGYSASSNTPVLRDEDAKNNHGLNYREFPIELSQRLNFSACRDSPAGLVTVSGGMISDKNHEFLVVARYVNHPISSTGLIVESSSPTVTRNGRGGLTISVMPLLDKQSQTDQPHQSCDPELGEVMAEVVAAKPPAIKTIHVTHTRVEFDTFDVSYIQLISTLYSQYRSRSERGSPGGAGSVLTGKVKVRARLGWRSG